MDGSLNILAIIALIVALAFFIGMIIWVISMKASTVEEHSRLPLTDDSGDAQVLAETDDRNTPNDKK